MLDHVEAVIRDAGDALPCGHPAGRVTLAEVGRNPDGVPRPSSRVRLTCMECDQAYAVTGVDGDGGARVVMSDHTIPGVVVDVRATSDPLPCGHPNWCGKQHTVHLPDGRMGVRNVECSRCGALSVMTAFTVDTVTLMSTDVPSRPGDMFLIPAHV